MSTEIVKQAPEGVDILHRVAERFPGMDASALAEAFPPVDPGVLPLGARVLLQIRTAKEVSKGGILLVSETKQDEQWQTQVALVRCLGPFAFQNREGETDLSRWVQPGDLVRVPRWGGDRFSAAVEGRTERALFCMFKDHEMMGIVTTNPLTVENYYL